MDVLAGILGLLIGAGAAWGLAQGRAAAERSRLRAHLRERVGYWQDEAERARARSSLLAEQAAAWAAGCEQGREDVLSIARALASHVTRADDDPAAG